MFFIFSLVACFPYITLAKKLTVLREPAKFTATVWTADMTEYTQITGEKDEDTIFLSPIKESNQEIYIDITNQEITMKLPSLIGILTDKKKGESWISSFTPYFGDIYISSKQIAYVTGNELVIPSVLGDSNKNLFAWRIQGSLPGEGKDREYWTFSTKDQVLFCGIPKPWSKKEEVIFKFPYGSEYIKCTLLLTPCEMNVTVPDVTVPDKILNTIRDILERINKKNSL